jgi:hypothetical protein
VAKRGRKVKVLPNPKGPAILVFPDPNNPEHAAWLRAGVKDLLQEFDAGHPEALLEAVILIVGFYSFGERVTQLLMERYDKWDAGEVASLDKAFRVTSHKGKLVAHRREIVSAVTDLRREGVVQKDAFKQVGKRFKAGQSSIGKIYNSYPRLRRYYEGLPAGTEKFRNRRPPKA